MARVSRQRDLTREEDIDPWPRSRRPHPGPGRTSGGTSSPEGDAPRAIHAAIVGHGLTRFGDVAAWVADELFGRDSAHAGFIASIGFFRAWYLVLACREIDRLRGSAISVIHHGGGDPPPFRVG